MVFESVVKSAGAVACHHVNAGAHFGGLVGVLDHFDDQCGRRLAARAELAPCAEELRFYFITSDVRLVDGAGPDAVVLGAGRVSVRVSATTAPKCVRCWQHRADVGTHASHPELCGRCVANVDGPGEVRHWF